MTTVQERLGAVPDGAVTEPLPRVVDSESFTPRLVALLSNSLVWRESRQMRLRFGLGTNDWRVLAALAVNPGSSATDVADFLVMNKAIVSKSVSVLTDGGLLVQGDLQGKSRPLYLTAAGARTHDEMLPISMRGQEVILEGLSPDEVERLNALLRLLLSRARELQASEAADEDPEA